MKESIAMNATHSESMYDIHRVPFRKQRFFNQILYSRANFTEIFFPYRNFFLKSQ